MGLIGLEFLGTRLCLETNSGSSICLNNDATRQKAPLQEGQDTRELGNISRTNLVCTKII